MPTLQKIIEDAEKEFEKILRLWHYENIRENGILELKSFLSAKISEAVKEVLEKIYTNSIEIARQNNQIIGEKNDYYVIISQLDEKIKQILDEN